MPKEVEVKILEINKEEVVKRLLKAGAKKTFEGDIFASYFDFPDARLKKKGISLRLRKIGEKVELNSKMGEIFGNMKSEAEESVFVDSFESLHGIFTRMGLVERKIPKKHRTSYKLGNAHFEIDEFGILPAFLEIEVHDEAHMEQSIKAAGFEMKDAKPWTQSDVLKHYGKI